MTLSEIIARLEAATGPDRELDGRIWAVVYPEEHERKASFKGYLYGGERYTKQEKIAHVLRMAAYYSPEYTASVDAALTLIPEGWWLEILGITGQWPLAKTGRNDGPDVLAWGQAKTAPLTVSATALRARSAI